MKSFIKIGIVLGTAVVMTSCFNKSDRNYQFFPNMYEAVPYEAYDEADAFPYNMEALHPADGSISRGASLYEYPDTNEGYEAAKANLKNPLFFSNDSTLVISEVDSKLEKGKELYGIYCAICHGSKGDGQGTLVQREKFLGVPSYIDRDITEGSVYHVIYYGKNAMGSYAAQLNEKERWLVTEYVMQLRGNLAK